jgi:hypothetical protein
MAVAGVLAVVAGGAVIVGAANGEPSARSAADVRGLSVKHMSAEGMAVDRTAQAGAVNVFEIENNSKTALTVTVKARPWTQSSSGLVSPNRRRELSSVDLSDTAFTLAKGEAKSLTVTLRNAASVYGALEIIVLPAGAATSKGVVGGYRIVSSLRYNPTARKYSLKAGAAKMKGSGSARALTLTIRNAGNTADPVTGRVRLSGPLGTRNGSIKSTRILPRKRVALALAPARALQSGTYKATVTLTQAKQKTTIRKTIRVKR